MKSVFKIAAATMLACASAAHAGPEASEANTAAEAGAQPAPAAGKGAAKEKKYCLTIEATTGSRLSNRECRTKAQWEKDGFDLRKAY